MPINEIVIYMMQQKAVTLTAEDDWKSEIGLALINVTLYTKCLSSYQAD